MSRKRLEQIEARKSLHPDLRTGNFIPGRETEGPGGRSSENKMLTLQNAQRWLALGVLCWILLAGACSRTPTAESVVRPEVGGGVPEQESARRPETKETGTPSKDGDRAVA